MAFFSTTSFGKPRADVGARVNLGICNHLCTSTLLHAKHASMPNYFISARVKLSQGALNTVEDFHDLLTDLAPEHGIPVPASSAHVTLATLDLPNDVAISDAIEALQTLSPEMRGGPLRITLQGLGHFYRRVVFVEVKEDTRNEGRLATLAAAVRMAMVTAGVKVGTLPFKAHVTLGKSSNSALLPYNDLKRGFERFDLGKIVVEQLELCPMGVPREGQYYTVCSAVSF
uniref:A-kinase anchor protein 7-like phosphoesterase domain-containing protein n=1 Tax=Mantoniella antarctica TaxID=81844 RepID=A0A7S0SVQ5_9CHLO